MKVERIYAQHLKVGDRIIVTSQEGDCSDNEGQANYFATITEKETNQGGITFADLEFQNGWVDTGTWNPAGTVLVIQ